MIYNKIITGLTFLASFFFIQESNAQLEKANAVTILPSDNYKTIIEKAANIVPSQRQLAWQQRELIAFFHFGINTFSDKEWGDGTASPTLFNPKKFDAHQWVKTVKDAGFKEVILTAKHHDGFCLWPSAYTEYSVKNSPWKNGKGDVVRAVSDACHELGMDFGIYLSPWDRNSKLYGTGKAYNQYYENQLRELLTNYGEIDEIWLDGANGEGPNGKKQSYDFSKWYSIMRDLQPQAVIFGMGPDVRWIGTESGYGRESEWSVVPINNLDPNSIAENSQTDVAFKPEGDMMGDDLGSRNKIIRATGLAWYPAEADVSIRPGWFYHEKEDSIVKSAGKLMDIYLNSVGKNGVMLLNIPPNMDGLLSQQDIKSVKAFHTLQEETFRKNYALGGIVSAAGCINPQGLIDDNPSSYIMPENNDTTMSIVVSLNGPKTFNLVSLQEFIPAGQEVEKWTLEYNTGNQWMLCAQGTTIGYKRMTTFPTITTSDVRLTIVSARSTPKISEIGLYKLPENWKEK
ncbi:alpha-L-fucosidase [Rhizosphaericola mali]|uniref:alpha-L-fucosidase n=1 Tax=Rhizosphaericola mali TaxID=2545455 RepID=A0A5P2G0D3_9BACT|nr:alpha-L-fucosidase [Rhizosphaericola mali]QES87579.1 alpha-L-fucosidase [Rhizosphaericola mali]